MMHRSLESGNSNSVGGDDDDDELDPRYEGKPLKRILYTPNVDEGLEPRSYRNHSARLFSRQRTIIQASIQSVWSV
jgi:hypothetical protein